MEFTNYTLCFLAKNSKPETRNSKQYRKTKIQMTKTWFYQRQNCFQRSLENWNIQILNLFRISIFELRIYFGLTPMIWAKAKIIKQHYS